MEKTTKDLIIARSNAYARRDPEGALRIAAKAARLAEEIDVATLMPLTLEGGGVSCALGIDRWEVEVEDLPGIYTFPADAHAPISELIAGAAWTAARAIVEEGC